MDCSRFHELLDDYLAERLDGAQRHEFRRHLGSCESCRGAALAAEPSLAFALMPAPRVSERQVDDCIAAVTARIRHDRLERRLKPRRTPWLAAAASIVVVTGAGLFWRGLPPTSGPDASSTPGITAAEQVAPPRIEVDSSAPGVRVYQYADGADDNTAAVFIVDEGLEL